MTTIIWDTDRKCVSQSHNLRGMFDWARRLGGVTSINVIRLHDENDRRPGAYVVATYRNGYTAETYFCDGSNAVDWANERSKASPRRSWFAGCTVVVEDCPTGQWDYEKTCRKEAV